MSKKFVVEADKDMDKDDVSTCLHNMDHYAFGTFKVAELPSTPEVKMVETGILMSPMDLITGAQYIEFKDGGALNEDSEFIGKRVCISENKLPKCCYRDIQKTWDFSSIPVGSLIKVEFDANGFVVGYYVDVVNNYLRVKHGDTNGEISGVHSKQIKSIRIVEGAK